MENIEKGYKDRNIHVLSDNQAATKAPNNFQTNSKLVWECHQSLVELAEHNRAHMVWVPGHLGIDGNEITAKLATEVPSHPLIGPESALGICAKAARGVIRYWTKRKNEDYWKSICGQGQAKVFLGGEGKKNTKKAGELVSLNRNQLRIMTGMLTGHSRLKEELFQLELVNSPKCDRCKWI